MVNKALNVIEKKLDALLKSKGYEKRKSNDFALIFAGESGNYIVNFKDNKFILSRESIDTSLKDETKKDNTGGECTILSEWFFDPLSSTEKDAESIANDFVDVLIEKNEGSSYKNKQIKKEKSKVENNGLNFFLNRLVTLFPELKSKVTLEKEMYIRFRYVTFIRENFVPLFLDLINSYDTKNEKLKRTINIFNNFYENGDMSVRSVITIVILNSLDKTDGCIEKINTFLKKELREAFNESYKYKNKKVKPEKVKNTLLKKLIKMQAQT